MNPWTLHRWRGCLLGTGGGLILMIVLGGFYTWLYLHHTAQVRAARATETSAQAEIEGFSPTVGFELPADGLWTAVCTHRPCAGCGGEWTWTLSVNLLTRTFESHAEFNESSVDAGGWLYTTHLVHEGSGKITEDGMLHGPFHETTTLTWSKAGVEGGPQVTGSENNMYGVIAADLNSICISRGEDPGAYDIDYIRRIGREAFFEPDKGCEAECTITKEP